MRLNTLLQLKERRPDFQVLAGNEEAYGTLNEEDFTKIDGLVSGNSNADPDLLLQYTQNPTGGDIAEKRQRLHEEIMKLSKRRRENPTETIESHIH